MENDATVAILESIHKHKYFLVGKEGTSFIALFTVAKFRARQPEIALGCRTRDSALERNGRGTSKEVEAGAAPLATGGR
jgi:hypothetical protein